MKEFTFTLLAVGVVFFTPIAPLMLLVAMFIVLDTLLGVTKAIKLNHKFTSHKLSRLAFKMFFYQMLIMMLYPIDIFLIQDALFGYELFATRSGVLVLIFIESLSIEENIKAVNNDKGFQYYFNKLVELIKSVKTKIVDAKKEL